MAKLSDIHCMSQLFENSPEVLDLLEFLRFASVSTDPAYRDELAGCADWLATRFNRAGLDARVIPTAGHPVVLARTAPDPSKKTVLIYGHYDVQPPDPLDRWTTPPFEPSIRDGKIYARGATDNKGQIFAHLLGVEKLIARGAGELPVNVIFLVEGEEETGSPNLPAFLHEHRDFLRADVVVVSDNGMAAQMHPTLAYALRGVAALECVVRGPSMDLHSGVYGGAVQNPITAAARLIASLHDDSGRIRIPGFYDAVRPLQDWERDAVAALPCSDADLLEQTGAPALFGEPGFSAIERVGARPTAEVNGFGGGYQGEGTKTVIPKEAFFKLTFRLVPDQHASQILDLAESHLRASCPPGVTLKILRGHSGEPFFTNPDSIYGRAARRALEATFGKPAALLREGGSIPILLEFQKVLGLDCLLLALAAPDCNAHSPDESFPMVNFEAGILLCQNVLREIAAADYTGDIPREAIKKSSAVC